MQTRGRARIGFLRAQTPGPGPTPAAPAATGGPDPLAINPNPGGGGNQPPAGGPSTLPPAAAPGGRLPNWAFWAWFGSTVGILLVLTVVVTLLYIGFQADKQERVRNARPTTTRKAAPARKPAAPAPNKKAAPTASGLQWSATIPEPGLCLVHPRVWVDEKELGVYFRKEDPNATTECLRDSRIRVRTDTERARVDFNK